jgi:transposase
VRAEVGDINRFGSVEQFICYCGLSPTVHQSSETTRYGRLNQACNRFLKYVLLLRANGIASSKADNPLRSTYLRLLLSGKKKNNVKLTVARQLTRVMFSMMREGAFWDPSRIRKRRASTVQAA